VEAALSSDQYFGVTDVYALVLKDGVVNSAYTQEMLAKLDTQLHSDVLAGKLIVQPYEVGRQALMTKDKETPGGPGNAALYGGASSQAWSEKLMTEQEAILNTMVKDAMQQAVAAGTVPATEQLVVTTSKMFTADMHSAPMILVSVAAFDQGVLDVQRSATLSTAVNAKITANEQLSGKCLAIGAGNHEALFVEALGVALAQQTPAEAFNTMIAQEALLITNGGIVPYGTGAGGSTVS